MEAAHSALQTHLTRRPFRPLVALWHGDRWDRAWAVLLAWFLAAVAIFLLIGAWSVGAHALSFGMLFGGLGWKYRRYVRPAMARLRLDNLAGFVILALGISALEEVWCFALGNKVALPVLWMDVAFCAAVWLPWFLAWRLFLSKRYRFSGKEALLLAASTGLLYELVGSGAIFANPAGLLVMVPLDIVVYAAIFVLPMQLIDFSGERAGPAKYLGAPILPYLLSWPVAALFLLFM
jgi:hypothetical protein